MNGRAELIRKNGIDGLDGSLFRSKDVGMGGVSWE